MAYQNLRLEYLLVVKEVDQHFMGFVYPCSSFAFSVLAAGHVCYYWKWVFGYFDLTAAQSSGCVVAVAAYWYCKAFFATESGSTAYLFGCFTQF